MCVALFSDIVLCFDGGLQEMQVVGISDRSKTPEMQGNISRCLSPVHPSPARHCYLVRSAVMNWSVFHLWPGAACLESSPRVRIGLGVTQKLAKKSFHRNGGTPICGTGITWSAALRINNQDKSLRSDFCGRTVSTELMGLQFHSIIAADCLARGIWCFKC